ncbi:hypothetical protein BDQ94DRAFT_112503 [Aspergillus welwitschiae]|uniref:Uncharacterized protein n=1 Tax=Aspergillus welwitschiae TaxID=1341132 RepID=A0A3F3PKU9_9EURO|nr:hypothetical protein BDQ94DRAFT_112503 [Aspergillus welwitschiae]RDH27560.1 hypothetical protein BDQ94DRAFT_112503 [Aspergillus welwitschiae]
MGKRLEGRDAIHTIPTPNITTPRTKDPHPPSTRQRDDHWRLERKKEREVFVCATRLNYSDPTAAVNPSRILRLYESGARGMEPGMVLSLP